MALYKIKSGKHSVRQANGQYKVLMPGETFEPTELQVKAFGDQFEFVGTGEVEPEEDPTVPAKPARRRTTTRKVLSPAKATGTGEYTTQEISTDVFAVVDPQGNVMALGDTLTEEEAQSIADDLNSRRQ